MIIGFIRVENCKIMKNLILPFLFVLFFTLTSCGTTYTVSTYTPYSVQWVDVYDYNRIHFLYTNYPQYVWTHYYSHPYFVRYRNESLYRGVYIKPYNAYTYPTRTTNHAVRTQTPTRYNSGRSNWESRRSTVQPPSNYRSSSSVNRNYNSNRHSTGTRSVPTRTAPTRSNGGRVNN